MIVAYTKVMIAKYTQAVVNVVLKNDFNLRLRSADAAQILLFILTHISFTFKTGFGFLEIILPRGIVAV